MKYIFGNLVLILSLFFGIWMYNEMSFDLSSYTSYASFPQNIKTTPSTEIILHTREKIQEEEEEEEVYEEISQFTVPLLTNDEKHIQKHGTRAYRNNNPGNLRFANQEGAIGKDGNGYAIFPDYETGKLAHLRQIHIDAERGLTLKQFVYKFAPPQENYSHKYLNTILKYFEGSTENTLVSTLNITKVQNIMQQLEGYIPPQKTYTAREEEIPEWIR